MDFLDLWLLGVALAMDCFTVSIVCGLILKRTVWGTTLKIAFLFGFFQALMPLIGWFCTSHFKDHIQAFDHWVAFGLLAFLGGKMIWGSFHEEEVEPFNPANTKKQLELSVATSIDALAIGISFACTGYDNLQSLTWPLLIIGICSFAFSIAGNLLGVKFGEAVCKRLKPELIGGLVLLFIGVKVLISHLLEEGYINL
ncbi:MAG: manganese efflux pump MntP family protein [Paludibacteraceae bacterium]|nr:manganese efflux pump MntP family protein [Paludibacteraceae bacterium]